jgi:predicted lipoprotein with Yx(FWY)xxD motif
MHLRPPSRTVSFRLSVGSVLLALATLGFTTLPVSAAPASVQLGSRSSPTLGTYLTGPTGHALYTLSSEPVDGVRCTAGCLGAWPPLEVAAGGMVHGPAGARGTFGTFVRSDTHATQAALNGHALYYFASDKSSDDTYGEGIAGLGGVWHVARVVLRPPTYEAVAGNFGARATAAALQAKLAKAGRTGYVVEKETTGTTGHYQVEKSFSTKAAAEAEIARLKAAKYGHALETDAAGTV